MAGVVLVSTCNRLEIYLDAARFHDAIDAVGEVVAETAGMRTEDVVALLKVRVGAPVAAHLFSVTAGLRLDGGRRGRDRRAGRPRLPGCPGRAHDLGADQPAVPDRGPDRQAGRHRHRVGRCRPFRGLRRSGHRVGRRRRWCAARSVRRRQRGIDPGRFPGAGDRDRRVRPGGRRRTTGAGMHRSRGLLAQWAGAGVRGPARRHGGAARRTARRARRRRPGGHLQWRQRPDSRRGAAERRGGAPRPAAAGDRSGVAVGPLARARGRFPGCGWSTSTRWPSRPTPRTGTPSPTPRTSSSPAVSDFEDQLAQRRIDPAVVALRQHISAAVEKEVARLRAKYPADVAGDVELALHRVTQSLAAHPDPARQGTGPHRRQRGLRAGPAHPVRDRHLPDRGRGRPARTTTGHPA